MGVKSRPYTGHIPLIFSDMQRAPCDVLSEHLVGIVNGKAGPLYFSQFRRMVGDKLSEYIQN
jgi:hypothetical protein